VAGMREGCREDREKEEMVLFAKGFDPILRRVGEVGPPKSIQQIDGAWGMGTISVVFIHRSRLLSMARLDGGHEMSRANDL
jgi:hypothetical protein